MNRHLVTFYNNEVSMKKQIDIMTILAIIITLLSFSMSIIFQNNLFIAIITLAITLALGFFLSLVNTKLVVAKKKTYLDNALKKPSEIVINKPRENANTIEVSISEKDNTKKLKEKARSIGVFKLVIEIIVAICAVLQGVAVIINWISQ